MLVAKLVMHGAMPLPAITLLFLVNPAVGLRVLGMFPHPGVSHFHFFKPIMQVLAAHGHNVTVVSHFPDPNPPPNYMDLPLTGLVKKTNTGSFQVS